MQRGGNWLLVIQAARASRVESLIAIYGDWLTTSLV
jgi:hypothetical protein